MTDGFDDMSAKFRKRISNAKTQGREHSLGFDTTYLEKIAVVACEREAQRERSKWGSETHSVPFQVLKYCTS